MVHNGIDVSKFQGASEEEQSKLKREFSIQEEHGPVIGNITRFEDKKNQSFALEVFRRIVDRYPDAVLLLGGPDGGKLELTKQRAAKLGLADRVRFIGERNDIPACLKLIDIYLFPSLYEGLPIALLEAQAAGCFCVSSTNVSKEVDMEIGQTAFCDLENGPEQWAEVIINRAVGKSRPTTERIQTAFKQKGYDIRWSAGKLIKLYE